MLPGGLGFASLGGGGGGTEFGFEFALDLFESFFDELESFRSCEEYVRHWLGRYDNESNKRSALPASF